jgi:hypothetical protein
MKVHAVQRALSDPLLKNREAGYSSSSDKPLPLVDMSLISMASSRIFAGAWLSTEDVLIEGGTVEAVGVIVGPGGATTTAVASRDLQVSITSAM